MTDLDIPANSTLSSTERLLARLGIRPEDKSVTALLFSNMFMSGIAIGMIRVCAFTLFLEHWKSEQLALIAILIAVVGMPMTLVIERLTRRFGVHNYLFTILGVILIGLATMRLCLEFSGSKYLVFTLPLFFELTYMLFSLQFLALLSRLLNVRQTKRLTGIARSGEFLAELTGGLVVVMLLRFMQVDDLLVVAMLTTLIVIGIVGYTINHFREALVIQPEPPAIVTGIETTTQAPTGLLGMLRLPYVRLITFCYVAYMFAYFFLEVAFYDYAARQFTDEKNLASFIAQFYALAGFLTMFTMIFLFAPLLRKAGIIAGIISFPLIIFLGASTVTAMETLGLPALLIFAVMVITNGLRIILQSAIWKNSVAILFQVLPDRQRSQGIALTEGVIDPLAGGLAGVCLFILTTQLSMEPKSFLFILSGLMGIWVMVGFLVRRHYLSNLMTNIQQRKLGEISLTELDSASLKIIRDRLNSQYPNEVLYCLNLLEAINDPPIAELLEKLLAHPDDNIRINVLERIANQRITTLSSRVADLIDQVPETAVISQALKTYATLAPPDTRDKLIPFLTSPQPLLRKGAMVGLLSYDRTDHSTGQQLQSLIEATDPQERILAADVIKEIGDSHFSDHLVELLADNEAPVVERAILASTSVNDARLTAILVEKTANPALRGVASHTLTQLGTAALYELDAGLRSTETSRQEKLCLLDTVTGIGGDQAIAMLLQHIDIAVPELRHHVYQGLATLNYQSHADDKYRFVNSLHEEVESIIWLLAAMEDLAGDPEYKTLHDALSNELSIRRDMILLLMSFLFPSIVILDTRANLDSTVSERRVFALEVLDNLLTGEIKEIVLPILDDLTATERLEQMSRHFPQAKMQARERFNDIVKNHYEHAFYWTRSCMLYQIGLMAADTYQEQVEIGLRDSEAVIRETALWCIAQLRSGGWQQRATTLLDDPSPTIRTLAQRLCDEAAS